MKFTLNWLKRYLDTEASPQEIGRVLTDIGLELEELTDPAEKFAPFTVATVEKAEAHPNADKLKVCTVKTADHGTVQVICGAPNARTGMKGIFAPAGSYVPGIDLTLEKTKIRGVESEGMLVSEREMELSDEHEGIIEVDETYEIGTKMTEIFGPFDPVFEISLTPNRADCAGVRGIARDLAAAGLGAFKPLETPPVKGKGKSSVGIKIEDKEGCPHFLGRTIKGVENGPSPQWLQELLKSVGLRPISALVDITNFMTLAHARPLHAYDVNKLKGDIVVREAKKGEAFEALNDKSYEMRGGEVAITDESGLLGLGGIVGGESTGTDEKTTTVFLESAYFDPGRIARTGRDLQVQSDARYRFERGVDPESTRAGLDIATQMILEICGGEASEIVKAGAAPDWKREIDYDPAYFQQLIGVDVPAEKQLEVLSSLGFEIHPPPKSSLLKGGGMEGGARLRISPPPWRGDINGQADITEEIIRLKGFDQIPASSVRGAVRVAETPLMTRARLARTALTARGLDECVTWSFMGKDTAGRFGAARDALTLSNPISEDMDQMRPSVLPNLIDAAKRNHDRGYGDAALCEIGPVYESVKPDGQREVAGGVRTGAYGPRHWADKNAARPVDIFDAKADALAALEAAGAPAANAQVTRDAPDYYHPGRSGALRLGKTVLAYFGELHPGILTKMDFEVPAAGFEIFLDNIPESRNKGAERPLLELAPLQPVRRDFAFIVDEDVKAEDLCCAVLSADKDLITDAEIFDIYQGKGVEEGKKSAALSVTIQPREKTLKDKEIEALADKITDAAAKRTGARLRS